MRMFSKAALIAAAMLGASSAQAATTITFEIPPGAPSGSYQSGVLLANQVSCDAGPAGCSGFFTANGSFAMQAGYALVGATLTSGPASSAGAANDIDFLTATLNGQAFSLLPSGLVEFGSIAGIPLQAVNNLVITGNTGGQGTFSGTLTFAQAVPEPGTWAMMLLGFGVIGFGMRRRRASSQVLAQLA